MHRIPVYTAKLFCWGNSTKLFFGEILPIYFPVWTLKLMGNISDDSDQIHFSINKVFLIKNTT